ncbi:MAG: GHKL domain-containing protein [Coriobacteriales bacterium]|jgi:signal transduction histidine kinase|nr:GHKL domain-containing protein [Coriobacteriales bacterium]
MNDNLFGRVERVASVIYGIVLVFVLALLIGLVLSARYNVLYHWNDLRILDEFTLQRDGQPATSVTLPLTIDDLQPGEKIVLTAEVETRIHDNLLIKADGAQLDIYVDDNLMMFSGREGTYPAFQKSPPPEVLIAPISENNALRELRLEYTASPLGTSLSVPEVYVSDALVLSAHLLSENGGALALSIILLVAGVVLIGVGLMVMRRVPIAASLLWLGLSVVCIGLWGISRNDFALYFIPTPALLYTLRCFCVVAAGIPLLRFAEALLTRPHPLPLQLFYIFLRLALLLMVVLHLLGIWPFVQSLALLQFLTPLAVLVFAGYILYASYVLRSDRASKYIIPSLLLLVFVVFETLNNNLHFFDSEGIVLQIGVLAFAIWVTALAWSYVRDVFDEAEKSTRLEVEIASMNRNLDMQRTLYGSLTSSTDEVRKLRHDLRHQLSAIKGFLQNGDADGALHYVEEISGTVPALGSRLLCDNFAVNAVVVHYYDLAEAEGIQTDLRLVVPADLGRIPDSDMSVIFGNLFENAIEACKYVDVEKRFIKITSKVDKNRLTLVIDNSFDGNYKVSGGEFISRKRESGTGIGISSVRTIVEKYGGSMKYEAANGIFMTSLYVKMWQRKTDR